MALADLNVRLGLISDNFQKGIRNAEKSLRNFGRQAEFIGQDLTNALTLPIVAAGTAAVKSFADFEKSAKSLEAVVGSAEEAAVQIERLQKVAQLPGLGFQEAVQASARLQAVGLSAGQAEAAISEFGNAVARSGGGRAEFDGAILALTQIASKGKISAEEINQLNERIFEIRPALVAAFGTADSEQLQKLGISSEEFIAKVTAEFSKLERVQGGLANAFENFGDTVRTSLATLGRDISSSLDIEGILTRISDGLSKVAERFSNLDASTRNTIVQVAAFAAAIGPAFLGISKIVGIGTSAVRVVGAIGGVFFGATGSVLKAVNAIKSFNIAAAASAAGPLIALAAGIAIAVSAFNDFKKRVEQANAAQIALERVNKSANASISAERTEVESLTRLLKEENVSRTTKENALKRLQQINPQYFGQLRIEKGEVEGLTEATNKYIDALVLEARIKQTIDALADVQNQLADAAKVAEEAAPSFAQTLVDGFLAAGNGLAFAERQARTFAENSGRGFKALEDQAKALQDQLQGLQKERAGITTGGGGGGGGENPFADIFPKGGGPSIDSSQLSGGIVEIANSLKTIINPLDGVDIAVNSLSDSFARAASTGVSFGEAITTALVPQVRTKEALAQISEAFSLVDQKALVFGENSFNAMSVLQEKINIVTTALNEALAGGFSTQSELVIQLQEQLAGLNLQYDGLIQNQNRSIAAGELFSGVISSAFNSFSDSLQGAANSAKTFGEALKKSFLSAVSALIKLLVAQAIQKALAGSTAFGPFAVPIAAAAGALASSVFKKIIGGAAFAEGGLVFGPTVGLIGEGPGTSRSNPEVIAPLDKLKDFIGAAPANDRGFVASTRISGSDLLILIEDEQNRQGRIR